MSRVTTITINTDASYNSQYKVGGYAFVIVCDHFRIEKSGGFKTTLESPSEAEIKCIGNALSRLLRQPNLPKTKYLIINTDYLHAEAFINKGKYEYVRRVRNLYKKVKRKVKSKENHIRHVKAHSGVKDARSHVNRWCDTHAKKEMKKLVAKIKSDERDTKCSNTPGD